MKEFIMKGRFITILVLIVLSLTACGEAISATPTNGPAAVETDSNTVTAEGTLLPGRHAELAFAQGGVVKELLFHPGERVAGGDVIARLVGVESVQAEQAGAKLEQTLAEQALEAIQRNAVMTSSQTEQALLTSQRAYVSEANRWNLGNEDEATELEKAIEDYITAEEDYQDARETLDTVLHLDEDVHKRMDAQEDFDRERVSQAQAFADLKTALAENTKTLDDNAVALLIAISNLEIARELQSRLNGSNLDPEILSVAEARLEAANAHLIAAEATIELYELRAPFDGLLLDMVITPGEAVAPTLPLAFLADLSRWIVETKDLAEIDVANISIGDPVVIKLDAFPDEEFMGTVTNINPVGKVYLGDMTYQITVTLDEPDPRFLWNMTATVTVNAEGK
jgi:multidrug resistance efflux pump